VGIKGKLAGKLKKNYYVQEKALEKKHVSSVNAAVKSQRWHGEQGNAQVQKTVASSY